MRHISNVSRYTYYRGRVALNAILSALGVGRGDEIAIQAFTCLAVPEGVIASGARPVYVDIEQSGFNMDAADLKRKITPATRAVIVQHTFGIPAEMDKIAGAANAAQVPIIEDCCHSFCTRFNNRYIGTFGVGSFYSFEWGKPIVVGLGGSAVVNDPLLRERVASQYLAYGVPGLFSQMRLHMQYFAFRSLYRPSFFWKVRELFHILSAVGAAEGNFNPVGKVDGGFSLRMAKSLRDRLEKNLGSLDAVTRHSRRIAAEYRAGIEAPGISHPVFPRNSDVILARYPLLAQNKAELIANARKANVELADWYSGPVHPLSEKNLHLVYYEPGSCPNAEARGNLIVSLPLNLQVRMQEVDRAIRFLNRFSA